MMIYNHHQRIFFLQFCVLGNLEIGTVNAFQEGGGKRLLSASEEEHVSATATNEKERMNHVTVT